MKTIMDILEEINQIGYEECDNVEQAGISVQGLGKIETLLEEWQKEIVQKCIDTLRNYKTGEPEEGEKDYRPGKSMSIGILYELKENI
jgi:hypothetical protein